MIPPISTATPGIGSLQIHTFGLSQSDKANYQSFGKALRTRLMELVPAITVPPEFDDGSFGGAFGSTRIFNAVNAVDPLDPLTTKWVNDTVSITAPGSDGDGLTVTRSYLSQRFSAPGAAGHKIKIGMTDIGYADQRGFTGFAPSITPLQGCQYFWDCLKYMTTRVREYYVDGDTASAHVYVMMPARFLLEPNPWMGTHRHAQLLLEAIARIPGFKFGVECYAEEMGDTNHLSATGQIAAGRRLAEAIAKQSYSISGLSLGPQVQTVNRISDTETEVVLLPEAGFPVVFPAAVAAGQAPMGFAVAPMAANLMGIINAGSFPGVFPTGCSIVNATTFRLTHAAVSVAPRLLYPFDRLQNFAALEGNFDTDKLIRDTSGAPLRWRNDGSVTGVVW